MLKVKQKKSKKKKKIKKKEGNIFSRPVILGVLAFVMALGGYSGYKVVKDYGKYGIDFDKRLHTVVEVVDGDTIIVDQSIKSTKSNVESIQPAVVEFENKGNNKGNDNLIKVRLLGVDAPEIEDCFGKESKKYLQQLVLGRKVFLEKDQKATDQYGRLLRYVILRNNNPQVDDIFVNNVLVQNGYAKVKYIKPNRRYLQLFQSSERDSQLEELGLWGKCQSNQQALIKGDLEREQPSLPPNKNCVIKGNISKKYTKDYFLPGCPNYKRVIVDIRKGEKWFCNEKEAKESGWKISGACKNIHQFEKR